MAEIHGFGPLRHFRSEANFHITRYRNGRVSKAGRGLAFWFLPDGASIAQIPTDDRDLPFHFNGRTKDHQIAAVQGMLTWRVLDPALLRDRVDFAINLATGLYLRDPLDQIATLLIGGVRQHAVQYLAEHTVAEMLEAGLGPLQRRLDEGVLGQPGLAEMGLEIAVVRLTELVPAPELDRALRTPTLEALQQKADQAVFERRAVAVEKERAIAENELQNKIELAKRQRQLIEQEDENARNRAKGEAEALEIAATGEAERIRVVETAKADMEKARTDIYRDMPHEVMLGLAAREFAAKLNTIEHLNVTPDLLGHLLGDLARAGVRRLDAPLNPEG